MIVTEAAAAVITEADVKMKRTANFRFRKNIRLLATTQIILKVLFISQMSLLCFYIN